MITFAKNDPTPVEKRNAMCLTCHTKGARLFWQGSAHESRDVRLHNCHKVMEDVSPRHQLAKETEIETCGTCHIQKRAQTMRSSHMPIREGKMTCTSCHNPHGTVTPALLKEPSLNDTCFTCHAEKRGPFLWNHPPVDRELRELPRPPRLQPREHAEAAEAAALPAVPHRDAGTRRGRTAAPRIAQVRDGPILH